MISRNLQEIRNRIAASARRSGRGPTDVTLVAVAKAQPASKILEAIEAGQRDFGENYAQEMLAHIRAIEGRFPSGVSGQIDVPQMGGTGWRAVSPPAFNAHFIGHLQRNKVKRIIGHVALIHTVDSPELAREIDKRAAALGKTQQVLIEVNLGRESSKTGLPADRLEPLVADMKLLKHVALRGLMAVPPQAEEPEETRRYFRLLREIRDALNRKSVYKSPLADLSMGMTHDFEVAIEEGATLVRIGTGIFGQRR